MSPRLLLAVAAGGGTGALLRYAVGELAAHDGTFPWVTLGINVTGSALLAALLAVPLARHSPVWAAALGPGLLGGFTTFSLASEETRALLADDHAGLALAYAASTAVLCLVAVALVGRTAPRLPPEDEW